MEIHLAREGLRLGPFTLERTNRGVARGEILLTDLAWHEGMTKWIPLAQVEGIVVPSAAPAPATEAPRATDPDGVYAGFWIRTVAYLIDGILLMAAAALVHFVVRVIMGASGADATGVRVVNNIVMFLLSIAYWCGFWISRWHASPGQRVCGLRVIARDGGGLSLGRALGRYFALLLAFLLAGLGVIMVAVTPRKQGLHDFLARTYVVKVQ